MRQKRYYIPVAHRLLLLVFDDRAVRSLVSPSVAANPACPAVILCRSPELGCQVHTVRSCLMMPLLCVHGAGLEDVVWGLICVPRTRTKRSRSDTTPLRESLTSATDISDGAGLCPDEKLNEHEAVFEAYILHVLRPVNREGSYQGETNVFLPQVHIFIHYLKHILPLKIWRK